MAQKSKKKKKKVQTLNVDSKLKNVKTLFSTGRIKEAIAYMYIIYTDLARQKFGETKKFSQTIRDFAIIMVTKYKQNPQNIYPFIQSIEKIVYGGHPATEEFFKELVQNFGKLYLELTGKSLRAF